MSMYLMSPNCTLKYYLNGKFYMYIVHVYVLSHVQLFATPKDCSLPGSSVHGIFQAKILERVAISSSRGSSLQGTRDRTRVMQLLHWKTDSLLLGHLGIMYIVPQLKKKFNSYSAKDDYRLSQENTETMVRNSGHVKHYGIWYSLKKKKKNPLK